MPAKRVVIVLPSMWTHIRRVFGTVISKCIAGAKREHKFRAIILPSYTTRVCQRLKAPQRLYKRLSA